MNLPTVCAVCLTDSRQEMTERAVVCFEASTYPNKSLLILDTGRLWFRLSGRHPGVSIIHAAKLENDTLGDLRNFVCAQAKADVLVTWDSDDWRHPLSMEEQVNALLASGKECVGYRDVLFWETFERTEIGSHEVDGVEEQQIRTVTDGRAFHWRSNMPEGHVLGGSIMFWKRAWDKVKFPTQEKSENAAWIRNVETAGMRSIPEGDPQPRMIALRHGGNTSHLDMAFQCEHAPDAWRRAPEWDAFCRERFSTTGT